MASFDNRRLRVLKDLQLRWGTPVFITCRVRTMEADFESVFEQLQMLKHKYTGAAFQQQKDLFRSVMFHVDSGINGDIVVRQSKRKHRSWWP